MGEETEIVQLSGLDKEEIARRVLEILNESAVERFTVLLQRGPKKNNTPARTPALRLEGRGSSSQNSYRTSQFAYLHRSSTLSNNDSSDLQSSCQTLSPLQMALHLYALGRHEQALEGLNALKEEGVGQDEEKALLVGMANCQFQLQRYQQAASLYRSVLTKHMSAEDLKSPQAAKLYNNLGSSYARLNLEKLSMNAFAQAIEIYHLHPHMDCSPLYSNIAGIYLKAGMPAAAEGYYYQALAQRKKKRPNQKELILHCYRKLAQAQSHLGKFAEAQEHLAKATKMAEAGVGSPIDTLKEEAALRERQGKWAQAIDIYEKLHLLHDEEEEGQGCRGYLYEKASRIYSRLGKSSQQRKFHDKAVKEYRKSGNLAKLSELEGTTQAEILGNSLKVNQ